MFYRAILLFLLLISNGIVAAKPKTGLVQAVRMAEAYVAEHKIPNSNRYLASVTWHQNSKQPSKSCWTVSWAPNESGLLDAQLVVWVCNNGKIRHQDSWA